MRVCVTGASGFVGSELVRALVAKGHEVIALGRGPQPRGALASSGAWLQCDLGAGPPSLDDYAPIDVVVHLAGRAHVMQEQTKSPRMEFWRANVKGTENIANAATAVGAKRLIFLSTIGVHGSMLGEPKPVTEESVIEPVDPYAVSKREAEQLLEAKAVGSGMELVILRPALVVGVGAPGNLARLAGLVRKGVPLPVPRRDNARSFIGLNNLVELMVCCIDHPDAAGQSFLVSEEEWPSTRKVIEWIGEGMEKSTRTIRIPARVLRGGALVLGKRYLYDKLFSDLRVDGSKVREWLDWQPKEDIAGAARAVGQGYRRSNS